MTQTVKEKFDVYSAVTNQIIQAIENGTDGFQMPWQRSGLAVERPTNIASGKMYRGINTVALWACGINHNFASGLWGTYKQWKDAGAQVRKGEKSSVVVFYKELLDETDREMIAQGLTLENTRCVARASRVFNVAQVEGYEPEDLDTSIDPINALDKAEEFITSTDASIDIGGERACYRVQEDKILMPDRCRFTGTKTSNPTDSWYSTLFHELTHWTGAQHRLDREFGKRFGDDAYAMEELVAELGAAFLCAEIGISQEPRKDHACYLAHWLRVMKGDNRAIFTAASNANKAATYLTGLSS